MTRQANNKQSFSANKDKDEILNTLKKLKKLENSKFPILTTCLGSAEKKEFCSLACVAQLHSMIHKYLSEEEQKIFKKDIENIESRLCNLDDLQGKGSVVFFTSPGNLWEVLSFKFYLPPLVTISYSPYLKPIFDALLKYARHLVILVDRERARFMTLHLGEVEKSQDIIYGLRSVHVDDKKTNSPYPFKKVAWEASEFIENDDIKFIIIGGNRGLFSKIRKYFPQYLSKMIIGEFSADLNIPKENILAETEKVVRRVTNRT